MAHLVVLLVTLTVWRSAVTIDNLVCLTGGIRFDAQARRCTVYDSNRALGGLFFGFGLFAVYILFFRPDIYKEVNVIIWIFRVVFPVGFGLGGLAMLVGGVRTVFDAAHGTFIYTKTSIFNTVTREGRLGEVTRIVLNARPEVGSAPGDSGQDRIWLRLALSMDLGGELVLLREWRIRPHDKALAEATVEAERLARFIGCRLVRP